MAERNALVEAMQRQLLVQEISNRILLAELDRLHLDLQYLSELRSRRVIRRWKTYHGQDCRFIHDVLPVSRFHIYIVTIRDVYGRFVPLPRKS